MSIGEHIYNISSLENDARDIVEITIELTPCRCCFYPRRRTLQALTRTCRLLAHEANDIFYRQTTLAFTSMKAVDVFFSSRNTALQNVRSLSILCGPAKRLCLSQKEDSSRTLRLLHNHAGHIKNLHFSFNPYYDINHDGVIFSSFWFHNLGLFRGLDHFSVSVDLDLMGPIGAAHVSKEDEACIEHKLRHAESALRIKVYRPKI